MNATANTEPAPTAAEYAQRIIDERHRLNAEQRLELELKEQRKVPVESGDDKVVDAIDSKIEKCVQRQLRIEERMAILQDRHEQAVAAERELADLALAEQAEALRQEGVKLIEQEYPKVAAPIVKLFERMRAIDERISEINNQISNPHKHVDYPNAIRTIPAYTYDEQIGALKHTIDSPKHPRHGERTRYDARRGMVFEATGEVAEPHFEPQIVKRHVHAVRQPCIPEAVHLPGIWMPKEST